MNGDPTTAEIYRTLQSHISDYKEDRDDIFKILEKQSKVGEDNLIQATKTNGRVTALELLTSNIGDLVKKHNEKIEGFTGDRKWITGGFAVVVLLMGVLTYASKMYIVEVANASVKQSIRQVLSEFNIIVNE